MYNHWQTQLLVLTMLFRHDVAYDMMLMYLSCAIFLVWHNLLQPIFWHIGANNQMWAFGPSTPNLNPPNGDSISTLLKCNCYRCATKATF
jgi:hypothetical protein